MRPCARRNVSVMLLGKQDPGIDAVEGPFVLYGQSRSIVPRKD